MTYEMYFADRLYSSWSLRGWLLLRALGAPFREHRVGLYTGTMADDLAPVAPARLVPVLRMADGTVVGESLAIAETLAERHPEAGLWPTDAASRATARWLCAEMASGFATLRSDCPMQLNSVYSDMPVSPGLRADLDRLDTLWTHARTVSGSADGWLFGQRSAADIFFAPVAARIIGYDLSVSDAMRAYCDTWLKDADFLEWRRRGLSESEGVTHYGRDLPTRPWPVSPDGRVTEPRN